MKDKKTDINNFLEEHKDKTVFDVPDNYFAELPHKIKQKIDKNEAPKEKPLYRKQLLKYAASLALIIAGLTIVFVINNKSLQTINNIAHIDQTELEDELFVAEMYGIDEYDLIEFLIYYDDYIEEYDALFGEEAIDYIYENTYTLEDIYELLE